MWLRARMGMVNLERVSSIVIEKDRQTGGSHVIAYDLSSVSTVLYRGSEESCKKVLDEIASAVGWVDRVEDLLTAFEEEQ